MQALLIHEDLCASYTSHRSKKKESALALSHTYRAAAVVTREQQCRQPLNISDAGPILHRYHTAYT